MSKFYIICKSYSPNTAVTNRNLSLIKGLSRIGVKATVIFLFPDGGNNVFTDTIEGIEFKHLWKANYQNVRFIKLMYDFSLILKLLLILKKQDVVLLLGCQSLCPLIVAFIDNVFHERTEHPDVVPWPRFLSRKMYFRACCKLQGLFVISESLKDFFVNEGCDPTKVYIINMTVDYARFSNIKKQKVLDQYIAYCGTASNNKDGVDELIKSFSIVAKRYNDLKLYIIGKIPTLAEEVENLKLISELGLEDKVHFTGTVSSSKMPQILKNAQVLALARPNSLQAQCGFPTKLGEYLLTENPVVVTKVGDIPKFLVDGFSALLSEERNVLDFSSKLLWALENPKDATLIGKRGKVVALKYFNADIEAQKMYHVIFKTKNE